MPTNAGTVQSIRPGAGGMTTVTVSMPAGDAAGYSVGDKISMDTANDENGENGGDDEEDNGLEPTIQTRMGIGGPPIETTPGRARNPVTAVPTPPKRGAVFKAFQKTAPKRPGY